MLDRYACPQPPDHSIVQLRVATHPHGKHVAPLRGIEWTASCICLLCSPQRFWSASLWGPGLVASYDIPSGERSRPIHTSSSRDPHRGAWKLMTLCWTVRLPYLYIYEFIKKASTKSSLFRPGFFYMIWFYTFLIVIMTVKCPCIVRVTASLKSVHC